MTHNRTAGPPRAVRGTALRRAAGLWLATAATVAVGAALVGRLVTLAPAAGRTQVDGLVELGVVALGLAVLVWLALSCAVAAGCLTARAAGHGWRRGERWVHTWAPVVVRRAVVLAVGAGLGLSAATGASAADVAPGASPAPTVTATTVNEAATVELGWVPTGQGTAAPSGTHAAAAPSTAPDRTDRTEASGATAAESASSRPLTASPAAAPEGGSPAHRTAVGASPSATTSVAALRPTTPVATAPNPGTTATVDGTRTAANQVDPGTVTVAAGDTLWSIAARHLPAGADDAQIAAAWPAWYAANSARIGADPDLIHPGLQLTVPAEAQGAAS